MCDSAVSLEQLDTLKQIERLLLSVATLPFEDVTVSIGATTPYVLDYRNRNYLYILSPVSLRLSVEDIAIISVPANQWTELCYQEGQRIFAPDNATALQFLIRATNSPMNVLPPTGSHVGLVYPAYSGNPTATANAAADTLFKWGTNGLTQVQHLVIQNNSGQNFFYAFDQDSTASTGQIYTLVNGGIIFWDRAVTVLHNSSASSVSYGGQTGVTIEGFL